MPLTEAALSAALLIAARHYHGSGHWYCKLFLLMPDHLHALLAFPQTSAAGKIVRNWKRGTARIHRVRWQENFFDHRIRNAAEENEKWRYIRFNPVAKKLCDAESDWPHWWSPLL